MTLLAFTFTSWWFLAFLVVFVLGVAASLYSRSGSGISDHPYHDQYGSSVGSHESARGSSHDAEQITTFGRGTK